MAPSQLSESATSPRSPGEGALLAAAARITRHIERHAVDRELLLSAAALWRLDEAELYQISDGQPPACRRLMAVHGSGAVQQDPVVMFEREGPLASLPGARDAIASGSAHLHPGPSGLSLLLPIRGGQDQVVRLLRLSASGVRLERERSAAVALLALYQNHLRLIDDSERDALTGLRNRRTFDQLLTSLLAGERADEAATCGFRRRPLEHGGNWLAVLDIDGFKGINDRFGHLFGDEVLILVANLMQTCFRASDPLFRFGGEEFVIVLCGVSQTGAASAVDRFRKRLEAQIFPQVGRITISAGYAEIEPGKPSSAILNRADAALYYAKQTGRNRACCYERLVARGLIEPEALCLVSTAEGAGEGAGIELF